MGVTGQHRLLYPAFPTRRTNKAPPTLRCKSCNRTWMLKKLFWIQRGGSLPAKCHKCGSKRLEVVKQ